MAQRSTFLSIESFTRITKAGHSASECLPDENTCHFLFNPVVDVLGAVEFADSNGSPVTYSQITKSLDETAIDQSVIWHELSKERTGNIIVKSITVAPQLTNKHLSLLDTDQLYSLLNAVKHYTEVGGDQPGRFLLTSNCPPSKRYDHHLTKDDLVTCNQVYEDTKEAGMGLYVFGSK